MGREDHPSQEQHPGALDQPTMTGSGDLPTGFAGLPPAVRQQAEAAAALVTEESLREILVDLVSVASPTGGEAPLAGVIAQRLRRADIEGHVMQIDDQQANAWGRLPGSGGGASLMLYAPIDTATTGDPAEDLPWVGELRPDLKVHADTSDSRYVIGLGASNPKGHAACIIAAAEAIAAAGIVLRGDLLLGFGAGGMPTNARPGSHRENTGQGVGCSFLLEQGVWPDFAIVAKPGWTVSWEEVGLSWFEIVVHGTHTYVGSRHRLPYVNPVALAGEVAQRLERWFPSYAEAHTDGLVSPQGIVASVRGGWERTASFTPEQVRLVVDLRLSPRTTPTAARRELEAQVSAIANDLDAVLEVRSKLAIAGETTDPTTWICRSAIEAWEAFEGAPHEPILGNSGATDANILRSRGVPTVRVGMPKVVDAPFPVDFAMGMNTVDLREAARLTRYLIRVALDTVAREIEEVGIV